MFLAIMYQETMALATIYSETIPNNNCNNVSRNNASFPESMLFANFPCYTLFRNFIPARMCSATKSLELINP